MGARCISLGARCPLAAGIGGGAQGERRSRPHGRRECYLGKQPTRAGIVDWHPVLRRPRASPVRHRRRSAPAWDRWRSMQQLIGLPACFLGRPHRHPRRADPRSARSAAPVRGPARRPRQRAQHRLHLALPRRRAGCRRHGDDLPQRPAHRHRRRREDRQGLGDRAHDRQRARGPRRELYRGDRARQQARRTGHARGPPARGRAGFRRHFA